MLEGLERLMIERRPDWVLVYGDTNSTLAGSLAASKLHIPVAHVEAGLRSFNRVMPEEINRVVADQLSDLLFAPTQAAVENLGREGLASHRVRLVGDVMYDAVLFYARQAETQSSALRTLGLTSGGYILSTIHRAENTDDPQRLAALVGGLARISVDLPVVVPLHPRTRKALAALPVRDEVMKTLHLIEPVGYLDMMMLEKHARMIVTDSGGVQKEAFFHGVPCVTLRFETEWVELVQSGWNLLVPPHSEREVYAAILGALKKDVPNEKGRFYGDGHAAEAIVHMLVEEHVSRSLG
jgi:UDP-GlcNAc3NAcA epimerase